MRVVTIRCPTRQSMSATTESTETPFASLPAFRAGFEVGLRRLLDAPTLGGFILVLANASFDAALYAAFKPALRAMFERWCERFDAGDPRAVEAAADDRAVFIRLRETGFAHLGITQWREIGPWRCQFNPLRAFRPPRMSRAVIHQLRRPFEDHAFHFNKTFLSPEIFWEGELKGWPLRLLYNKYPFADLHGLLVPEPDAERPQYLDATMVEMIFVLNAHLGEQLPGMGFGYNAYGAFASVNHLHFQHFISGPGRYPIEHEGWVHQGGDHRYPLPVTVFDDPQAAWHHIEKLQRANRAFNLLVRPARLYVIERALQGSYMHSAWTGGFAWAEVAGAVTVSDPARFASLDEAALVGEFMRLAPPAPRVVAAP